MNRAVEMTFSMCDLNLMVAAQVSNPIGDSTELTAEELGWLYDLVHKLERPAME